MKLKNVAVGQSVKVKRTASTFEHQHIGAYGTVVSVDNDAYTGYLTVRVRFQDGLYDWGSHKDIKPIKL